MAVSWVEARRVDAWVQGRALRDRLLAEYCERYRLATPPPPANVIDELLTEHLNVRLTFDPLPLDRFAETALRGGEICVTINSDTASIAGVKDVEGVQNVAKWHEAIHVVDHSSVLRDPSSQLLLDGFAPKPPIICYRSGAAQTKRTSQEEVAREFWAEEAGRAAAVSLPALRRTQPFIELLERASRSDGPVRSAFPLLYQASEAIGVNISALIKQLQGERLIAIERNGSDNLVFVQSHLLENAP